MDKFFLIDSKDNLSITYKEFYGDISKITNIPKYCYSSSLYKVFLNIVSSLIHNRPLIILDSDFSLPELEKLGIDNDKLSEIFVEKPISIGDYSELEFHITNSLSKITLFTSGTTGVPKKVEHSFSSLAKAVITNANYKDNRWGFAYNPTHIAGIQVFMQALLNENSIINVFNLTKGEIFQLIKGYEITNISATPTFYRLLFPNKLICNSVEKITSGGEKFDAEIKHKLAKTFPNSKFRNIYASTEAGSIFGSVDDAFIIPNRLKDKVKIINSELYLHKSLLGSSHSITLINDLWYNTGDVVEIINQDGSRFKFVTRKNTMLNVGGYKVNPEEVEDVIRQYPGIDNVRVFGKPNSVIGTILVCQVVAGSPISLKKLKDYLAAQLQEFKIPRIIDFVESIDVTRTGKIKR